MSESQSPLAIDVDGVRKSYGSTHALKGVDFKVPAGSSRALIGRNGAGKSTLIGALTGLVEPDEGSIRLFGGGSGAPEQAGSSSLACVFQKSALVDDMTAAENISLGQYPRRAGRLVDWPGVRALATAMLSDWGFSHIADQRVETLPPLERKIVEICRAMAAGPRILLLDEPTAGLDEGACSRLFEKLREARQRGVTIVYVSHHLDEIYEVCDSITILRDGEDVLTRSVEGFSIPEIVSEMLGEQAAARQTQIERFPADFANAPIAVQVRDASVAGRFDGVDIEIRRGECYGLTGLDGAGHVALARAVVGAENIASGAVELNGRPVPTGRVADAIAAGVGFVPEDRHESGFVPSMSVEENATLTILPRLRSRFGWIDARRRAESYLTQAQAWSIKASGPDQPTEELSGGNQQKVVMARALASDPDLLVLINPTAGVDIAAKESIYATINTLRSVGKTVIICSTDDADLAVCDRVGVMFKGRLLHTLAGSWDERDLVSALHGSAPTAA